MIYKLITTKNGRDQIIYISKDRLINLYPSLKPLIENNQIIYSVWQNDEEETITLMRRF